MGRFLAALVMCSLASIALAQASDRAMTWEYALYATTSGTRFLWESEAYSLTHESDVREGALDPFAEALADHYEVPEALRGEGGSNTRIWNIVGSVGWELVDVTQRDYTTYYWFKRPRR